MNKIFLYGFLLCILSGCMKGEVTCQYGDSTVNVPATEIQQVQTYLTNNGITDAIQSPAGFFYKIVSQGSGASIVNLCSQVGVKYTGKLTNGTVFDETASGEIRTFTLGQLIIGWQKALPLLNAGGKIILYIPPSLGYGSRVVGDPPKQIPANSILIFDMELVNVL